VIAATIGGRSTIPRPICGLRKLLSMHEAFCVCLKSFTCNKLAF
jgi:hypothetical protein